MMMLENSDESLKALKENFRNVETEQVVSAS